MWCHMIQLLPDWPGCRHGGRKWYVAEALGMLVWLLSWLVDVYTAAELNLYAESFGKIA